MSTSKKKWFLIFLYLVSAFVVATSLGFILISSVIEFCISIYTKRSFDFSNIDFIQCIKIGIGGGGIGAIGCWFIYYKNYK
ncbi:hypothetical protein [Rosenbergiella epipactidis]|uniref:hypothetical protein n=1 Tax=Rosenbergiella epipactidis TaxID=1544694 RepID=UPI001F4E9D8E|nr:hypothetical protein [Rosenbergiella epipactidis]